MFSLAKCNEEDCSNKALTFRDKCFIHLKDKNAYITKIKNHFQKENILKDLELTGITLSDLNLSSKEFHYCNLSQVAFNNITIENSKLYLSFFEFPLFFDIRNRFHRKLRIIQFRLRRRRA